jgi:hypothetical protein
MSLRTGLLRGLAAVALIGGLLIACQGPDEYFRNGESVNGSGGDGTDTGGTPGTGGGTGGIRATGGTPGTGGQRPGTGGIRATGGTPGTGGTIVTGAAGRTGTGAAGRAGTGGRTGTGGLLGTAGTRGEAGRAGTGGLFGGGGRTGTAGTFGRAGASGTAGSTGTGPCAGLCDMPIEIKTTTFTSGNVGTGAACYETTQNIMGGNCSNVPAPRTFSINGKAVSCAGSNFTLPAKINGGYCFEFSAGTPDYSAFTTF